MQKLLYGILGVLLLLLVVGFLLPRTHPVEASIEIDAPPATIFALVNDLRRQAAWSPWVETDPNARILYSGAPRGEGAVMSWDGAIIGSGTQVITASVPDERVEITMNPGEDGEALSQFVIERGVASSRVTWRFVTDHGYNVVGRYFAPLLGGVVEREYQLGLERLKDLAESLPPVDIGRLEVERMVVEAADIAYLPARSRPEPGAIAAALGNAYFEILKFIDDNGLRDDGAPLSIARGYAGAEMRFDAAIPIRGLTDETPREAGNVRIGKTYAGAVIRVTHTGSYARLAESNRQAAAYLAIHGIERNGAPWESYVSDPGSTPEADLVTYLYYPIRVD